MFRQCECEVMYYLGCTVTGHPGFQDTQHFQKFFYSKNKNDLKLTGSYFMLRFYIFNRGNGV